VEQKKFGGFRAGSFGNVLHVSTLLGVLKVGVFGRVEPFDRLRAFGGGKGFTAGLLPSSSRTPLFRPSATSAEAARQVRPFTQPAPQPPARRRNAEGAREGGMKRMLEGSTEEDFGAPPVQPSPSIPLRRRVGRNQHSGRDAPPGQGALWSRGSTRAHCSTHHQLGVARLHL
jgi:hypothetical protein